MGGPVYGLIVTVAVVLCARKLGYDWRAGAKFIFYPVGLFCASIALEPMPVASRDLGAAYVPAGAAAAGWFVLLFLVIAIGHTGRMYTRPAEEN